MAVAVRILIFTVALGPLSVGGWAQDVSGEGKGGAEQDVAATVNNVSILVADVDQRVRQALGRRKATDSARPLLEAEALEQLVAQEKVLVQLQQRDEACTPQEVEVELQRLQDNLARQEKTLDDYCQSLQLPLTSVRRMLQWQLSWKRCRSKYLTDDNLKRYFDRHRSEFDGTTIRVAQVLLQSKADADRQQLVERAREIRKEIVSGQISFGDAARKYSQSPSSHEGGELNWISRHAPMPEFFSKVAFQLKVGETSMPVESPYGVHLIRCLEIKPGQRQWQEVRETLRDAVAEYLFHWLADRPVPKHDVRYTGNSPHFKPGTRELAELE